MIIIIAEKPDMAKKIMKAISPKCAFGDGFYYNNEFIFTFGYGHLTALTMPDEIDNKYANWQDISYLPFRFKDIPLKTKDDTVKQFNIIKKLIKDNINAEIINACDADREGELIFRNILTLTGLNPTNMSRMWISSATPEGIQKAFDTRKPLKEYNYIGLSAKARSYGDYLVGLSACRIGSYYFTGGKLKLSIGRVQTPTLKMIVDRKKEIDGFESVEYLKLFAKVRVNDKEYLFKYRAEEDEVFKSKEEIVKFAREVGAGSSDVIKNEIKSFSVNPPKLYALSDLQFAMDKKYKYGANEVLNICQALYEKHGLTTYPRTDENRISEEWAYRIKQLLPRLSLYKNQIDEILKNDWEINEHMIFDGEEVGSHEALTPTFISNEEEVLKTLNEKERNVYDEIVKRTLLAFYPAATGESQQIIISRKNHEFIYNAKTLSSLGFQAFDKEDEDDDEKSEDEKDLESEILHLKSDKLDIITYTAKLVKPKPPKEFTEGSLIKMMKNPSKYLDDESEKKIIKSVEGIGTEATRAGIIENLKKSGLIEVKKNKLVPTEKGIALIDLIPDNSPIKSVALTALFESKLSEIAKGKYDFALFMNDIERMNLDFMEECQKVAPNKTLNYDKRKVICKCPVCGSNIVEGKYGYHCTKCKASINFNALEKLGKKKITETEAKELFTKGITKKSTVITFPNSGKEAEVYLTYTYDETAKYINNIGFEYVYGKK